MRRRLRMCIINTTLIDDLAPMVGSQTQIMRRLGISWNSWVKIRSGQPIRLSVGERLRSRVLANIAASEGLQRKFYASGGIDRAAFEAAFLWPAPIHTGLRRHVASRMSVAASTMLQFMVLLQL